jgi:phosphatidylglycerophosphate synthase
MFVIWYAHAEVSAPLRPVLGLSLAKRAVACAKAAGFGSALVVVHREDVAGVERELANDHRVAIDLRVVAVESYEAGKDLSREDDVVLALGDRVWPTALTKQLAAPLGEDRRLRVICDSAKDTLEGHAGLYRVRGEAFAAIDLPSLDSATAIGEALVREGSGEAAIEHVRVRRVWKSVRSDADLSEAETLLLDSLKKSTDGVISRNINRRISLAISRRLARTSLTPNHVTAVVFLVGVASGPLAFFLHSYWGFLLGASCYYVSAILDGCDGEISRLKFLGSPLGAWLDTVVDDLVCLSYIVGVYGRFAIDTRHPFWIGIGVGGLFFYLLTILPRYWVMATTLGSGDYQQLAKEIRPENESALKRLGLAIRDVIFRTDFLPFYAFVTALCNYVPAFAVPFALGSVASAVDTLATIAKTRRSAAQRKK